jgi:hypothetical protein
MIDELREQVIKYLDDAHALEQHVARQLDAMIETTEDPEIAGRLRHHRKQTERHEVLRERLEAYDESPSWRWSGATGPTSSGWRGRSPRAGTGWWSCRSVEGLTPSAARRHGYVSRI